MGGKGSGRKPNEKAIVNSLKPRPQIQQPIATDMFLPNHSGLKSNKQYGIWSRNGKNIYYDEGNVGIGTDTPSSQFHIKTTNSDCVGILQTTQVTGTSDFLLWNGTTLWRFGMYGGVDNNDFAIKLAAGDAVFRMHTSGNVTIPSGNLSMNTHKITNVVDPTADQDAATKKYVDDNAGASPLTTKGDLYTYDTADTRLPIGTNDQVLTADSTQGTGLKWATPDYYTDTDAKDAITRIASITVEEPDDSEDITILFTPVAITISEMRAVLIGSSTPSVTWTIRHHATDRSNAGNEVVTSGTTTTSTTSGSDVTSFNDATIPADSFVWLETTAQSGTVTELHVSIVFTED